MTPRHDDGKRGFAVTDAWSLEAVWRQWLAMAHNGEIRIPASPAPEGMRRFFEAAYPPDQWEEVMRRHLAERDVETALIDAIRSDQLPLWIAPVDGALPERLVAGSSFLEFSRESLIAGCYRPQNDTAHLAAGYPLYVKKADWGRFVKSAAVPADAVDLAGPPSAKFTAGAERECSDWLRQQFASDPQGARAKGDFLEAAIAAFGGRLSKRAFERAWATVASGSGRAAPGRKRNHRA